MTTVSGRGPWPGGPEADALEAQQIVLGDLSGVPSGATACPFLVQLPGRGPGADAVGRTGALLPGMPVELGPHGWKLAAHGGADLRRASAFLRDDLGALAIGAYGYAGPFTVTVVGPWTLAARLYLERGDRVLSDAGAVREAVASLAVGLGDHVAEVRSQVPGADVVVQVDEPLLAPVLAGALPTFSGYSRLRAVAGPDAIDGLRPVLDAARAAGARSVVHVGRAWAGVAPAVLAGADGVGLDLGDWDERTWEVVARAVERGLDLWAGLPPATVSRCAGRDLGALADVVAVPWRRIGLPPARLGAVTVLAAPRASGTGPALVDVDVAGAGAGAGAGSVEAERAALRALGGVAEILAERAQG